MTGLPEKRVPDGTAHRSHGDRRQYGDRYKVCGGCNPGYVREELVKKLKERFPHHIYVTASERTECDIWLLVCGCSSACVSGEGLSALKKRFVLTSRRSFRRRRIT